MNYFATYLLKSKYNQIIWSLSYNIFINIFFSPSLRTPVNAIVLSICTPAGPYLHPYLPCHPLVHIFTRTFHVTHWSICSPVPSTPPTGPYLHPYFPCHPLIHIHTSTPVPSMYTHWSISSPVPSIYLHPYLPYIFIRIFHISSPVPSTSLTGPYLHPYHDRNFLPAIYMII